MNSEELLQLIEEFIVVRDGKRRIDCSDALDLAKKNNLKPAEIAKVLNANKIKLSNCQLGCFS